MEFALILSGIVNPAAVAFAAALLIWRPWRAGDHRSAAVAGTVSSGLVLALGYGTGHVTVSGWPALWPKSATYWMLHLTLLAVLAGTMTERRTGAVRSIGRLAWASAAGALLFGAHVRGMPLFEMAIWIGAMVATILVFWWSLSRLVTDLPERPLTILLGLQIATFGAVFANCHDLQAAQLSGALGGALAGVSLVVWKWPSRCNIVATIPILTMWLAPMLTIQHTDFFGTVPRPTSACLAAAPLLCIATIRWPGIARSLNAWWILLPATTLDAIALWTSWPTDPYSY